MKKRFLIMSPPILKEAIPFLKMRLLSFQHIMIISELQGIKLIPALMMMPQDAQHYFQWQKHFRDLKKKPLRSILFLWVSGEEIGLYGSESYVNNPLFPLDKTVSRSEYGYDWKGKVSMQIQLSETPMTGPESIFVITDNQSNELRGIADDADSKSRLTLITALAEETILCSSLREVIIIIL